MTELVSFPPTILLVEFFRRIKRKNTRIAKIKQMLRYKKSKTLKKLTLKTKILEYKFPWWCKFIAYFVSFVFVSVSLIFIIIQGIMFGNEKVQKWLTSILISIFSSVLLTQPLKVIQLIFSI